MSARRRGPGGLPGRSRDAGTFGLCELGHSLIEAMLAATGLGLEDAATAMALRAAHEAALRTGWYRRVMQLAEEHLRATLPRCGPRGQACRANRTASGSPLGRDNPGLLVVERFDSG